MEKDVDKGFSKELEADVQFLGYMEGVEAWARAAWKKNPQLLEFYKTVRLSQVATDLDQYDHFEKVREAWRNGRGVSFFNGQKFEERIVIVGTREELKKVLLDSVRSFVPDPDDMSPEMENYFFHYGSSWMDRGLPTCWQEYNSSCFNPDYDGSLSWDED